MRLPRRGLSGRVLGRQLVPFPAPKRHVSARCCKRAGGSLRKRLPAAPILCCETVRQTAQAKIARKFTKKVYARGINDHCLFHRAIWIVLLSICEPEEQRSTMPWVGPRSAHDGSFLPRSVEKSSRCVDRGQTCRYAPMKRGPPARRRAEENESMRSVHFPVGRGVIGVRGVGR